MSDPRKWLIRRSRFPFEALGDPLGVVIARNLECAYAVASCHPELYAKPYTVEPLGRTILAASPAAPVVRSERRRPRVGLFEGVSKKRLRGSE